MATPQFKVNQLAKDLGLKTKDVTDVLKEKGVEAKSQQTLSPAEFDLVFDRLTKSNQITNIEDYLDGITYIPSAKKESAPKEDKPAEPKAEVKAEPKTEPKVEVKAEPKTERTKSV